MSKIYEIKYKWFQTRLVHKVLATSIILKEMNILNNHLCNFCNREKETNTYFF